MHSDDSNVLNATGDDRPDETTDSGIATLPPGGADPAPESVLTDTTRDPGTVGADDATPALGQLPRLGLQSGARIKPFSFGLPTPLDNRPTPLPRSQPEADFPIPQQADLTADLMDTVARLRNEIYALQLAPPVLLTPDTWTPPARPMPVAFTTTKVPNFSGSTSWDQYRPVFDAIVRSNGWDDATVALQLLSHLEGDALNVALLVPEATRVMRIGLVGALTDHAEDPSKFAVAQATPPRSAPTEIGAMLQHLLPRTLTQAPQPRPATSPQGLDWGIVLLLWQLRPRGK